MHRSHYKSPYLSAKRQPKAQLVSVAGATGRNMPKPEVEPAGMTIFSSGVGTCSQPLRTLKASSRICVFAPAPSAEAFVPEVPAAPAVPPVIFEAGPDLLSAAGAVEVSVGNAVTCVSNCALCCADVAFADCPIQKRKNSRFGFGAAAGLTKVSVTLAFTTVIPPALTIYSIMMLYSFL